MERVERRARWRRLLVGALVVVTSVGIFASTIGFWVHSQVYDTDAWISTVEDLPSDPAVAEALATELSQQIIEVADAEERVGEALPGEARALAAPITTALGQLLEQALVRVLESDQFRSVWIAVNRVAHESLVAILDDGRGPLEVSEGTVQLDLLPLISDALSTVADEVAGLLGDGEVPHIDPETPRAVDIEELSEYFGVEVPENFGQITVFESSELAVVQDAATTLTRVVWLLPIVTIALLGLALGLSRDRRRTLIGLGLGAVTAIVVSWVVGQLVRDAVLAGIDDAQSEDAARAALRQVLGGLRSLTQFVLAAGTLIAAAAFLTGDHPAARRVRRHVAAVGAAVAGSDDRGSDLAAWVGEHAAGVRAGGFMATLAFAAVVNLTWMQVLLLLALLVVYMVVVTAMVRTARAGTGHPVTDDRAV